MYIRSDLNPADIVSSGRMPSDKEEEFVKAWRAKNFEIKPPEIISDEDIPILRVSQTVLPAIQAEKLKVFSKYGSYRFLFFLTLLECFLILD